MTRVLAIVLLFASGASAQSHFWQSKRFWIPVSVTFATAAADFATSQHAWAMGQHELDPVFFARQPSFGRMLAIDAPYEFALSYAYFRRPGHAAYLAIDEDAAEHIAWSVHNMRVPRMRQ